MKSNVGGIDKILRIVVGLGLATIETNALFLERLRTHGAAKGEPRRFPFTTPNAGAGECGVEPLDLRVELAGVAGADVCLQHERYP